MMQYSIDDLVSCVNTVDAPSFLLVYLELIKCGCTLSVPQERKIILVKQEWKDIVPQNCVHGTEAFFMTLAELWLDLVMTNELKDQDQIIDSFILQIKFKHKSVTTIQEDGQTFRVGSAKLKDVQASISDRYKYDLHLKEKVSENTDILENQLNQALYDLNAYDLFDAYLQLQFTKTAIQFPKSSVLSKNRLFWKAYLDNKGIKSDDLSKALASYSFALINKTGIPRSVSDLRVLWSEFKNNYNRAQQKPITETWFAKTFKWLLTSKPNKYRS